MSEPAKLMGMARSAPTPGVEYVIVLFDRTTSRIAAFVDANLVTAYRTSATSAASLDRLAPQTPTWWRYAAACRRQV
jgi:ornithine cyclodeaminase/alanine dehydrogenase